MKISRIERTAKEAMELADYVYNSRDVEFVEIIPLLTAEKPHTVTFRCSGAIDLEIAFFGELCDVRIALDDEETDVVTERIWRKSFEGLGRSRHTLKFSAAANATYLRLCIKAKGGLRI